MTNDWREMFRVESVLGQVEIALNVAHSITLSDDDRGCLRRLILDNAGLTPQRIYWAITTLAPDPASAEEISSAIQKVAWILDGQIFRSGLWWSGIAAFKEYDSLASLRRAN